MRIGIVCQPLDVINSARKNSIGILTCEIAQRLSQKHQVCIYSKSRYWLTVEVRDGISFRFIPIVFDKMLLLLLTKISNLFQVKKPLFASSLFYLFYGIQTALDIKQQQLEIVHIHNFSQFIPIIRALNPRVKIVLHMHCEWLTQLDPKLIESRLTQADCVLSCSEYITEKNRCQYPRFSTLFQTLYNGIDPAKFRRFLTEEKQLVPHPNSLLFIGRVSPEKGVHILLEAFAIAISKLPDLRLKIVGPRHLVPYDFIVKIDNDACTQTLNQFYPHNWLPALEQYQNQLHLCDHIEFLGHVPYHKITNFYQSADLFIFPSVWNEPFGMPLIEAMAAGVPAIATQGGAFPEIIDDGQTGLLVERGNANALAEAIVTLLTDTDLRQNFAKRSQQKVFDRFSYDRLVDKLTDTYTDLLKN